VTPVPAYVREKGIDMLMTKEEKRVLAVKVREDVNAQLRIIAGALPEVVRCTGHINQIAVNTAQDLLDHPLSDELCMAVDKKIAARRRAERRAYRAAQREKRAKAAKKGWAARRAAARKVVKAWREKILALVG
jgi:hypothetical protein